MDKGKFISQAKEVLTSDEGGNFRGKMLASACFAIAAVLSCKRAYEQASLDGLDAAWESGVCAIVNLAAASTWGFLAFKARRIQNKFSGPGL